MNKAALTFALLLTTSLGSVAHTIDLGYVNKQGGASTGQQVQGKTASSAAILLPKASLMRYTGNEFRSVRVDLPKLKNLVDSVVVWVRSSADGENLATGKMTRFKDDEFPTLQEGWNEVTLTQSAAIEAGKDYYIGYTYYQRTKVCATNYYYRGTTGYSYLKLGDEWKAWDEGALCIEAGIDGAAMPQYDFQLQGVKGIVESDGQMTINANLFNIGQATATQLTFRIEAKGFSQTVNVDANTLPNTFDTLRVPLTNVPEAFGPGTEASISLTAINGNADTFPEDNSGSCVFNSPRLLLIEEFTTEQCPNCPAMGERLNKFLHGGSELGNQSVMVCHHAGYNTDGFTTQADLDYEWFYNNGGDTYAPAVMFNRRPYNVTDSGETPVVFPTTEEQVMGYASDCLSDPSTLILSADVDVNLADSFVTINVKGRKLDGFNIANPQIFVFLTEDNVLSTKGQAGSGTDTYYHQHIVRGQNRTWGEDLNWDGDAFTYNTSFDLQAGWKVGDMAVVASVGNYDETNPGNCEIENSAAVRLKDVTNAIDNTRRTNGSVSYTYYNVNGAQIAQPGHGVTIAKGSDGSLKKIVRK